MTPDESKDFKAGIDICYIVIAGFLVCWNDWQLGIGILLLTGRLNTHLEKIREQLK